jgi:hypothetical protein
LDWLLDDRKDLSAEVIFNCFVPVNEEVVENKVSPFATIERLATAVLFTESMQEFGMAVTEVMVPLPGLGHDAEYTMLPLVDVRHLFGVELL